MKNKPASEKRIAKRITMKRGKMTKKLLLVGGPCPKIGDELTLEGVAWFVTKVKDEEIFAEFSTAGGKLKQVFP